MNNLDEFIENLKSVYSEFESYSFENDKEQTFENFIEFLFNRDDYYEEEREKEIKIAEEENKINENYWKSLPITDKQNELIDDIVKMLYDYKPEWIVDRGSAARFIDLNIDAYKRVCKNLKNNY